MFASSSSDGIAGTPSSRLNFTDCLLMDYKDFLSSLSSTKWRRVSCVSWRYLSRPIVVDLWESSSCMSPLPSSVMGSYSLSTSDLGWCILYMVRNFLVFVSSLVSSCNVQFMMLRPQVTTGTAKVSMASSLFAEFSSDLRLIIIIIILFMLQKCPFGRYYAQCSDYIMPA